MPPIPNYHPFLHENGQFWGTPNFEPYSFAYTMMFTFWPLVSCASIPFFFNYMEGEVSHGDYRLEAPVPKKQSKPRSLSSFAAFDHELMPQALMFLLLPAIPRNTSIETAWRYVRLAFPSPCPTRERKSRSTCERDSNKWLGNQQRNFTSRCFTHRWVWLLYPDICYQIFNFTSIAMAEHHFYTRMSIFGDDISFLHRQSFMILSWSCYVWFLKHFWW